MIQVLIRMFLLCLMISLPGCGCEKREDGHKEGQGEHHGEEGVVHLKEESQKMIGLELVKPEKRPLLTSLKVVGEIAAETEDVFHITCPHPGILKSFLKQVGETVEEGTPLCAIEAKTGETLEIPSRAHGIVLAQYVKPGDKVDGLTSIMTIANPDILRASFNVYEKDLAGIKLAQKVIVESISYPDQRFDGEIVFVSPSVDTETRAIKIRVHVSNKEHLLKFGMFVTGEIIVPLSEEALVVPESAVQEVEGAAVVFMPSGVEEDEFQVREIKTGRASVDFIEILEGLTEGDIIAGKGSFYLKSELLKSELEEGHAH